MHTAVYFKNSCCSGLKGRPGTENSIALITMTTFVIKPLYKMAMYW